MLNRKSMILSLVIIANLSFGAFGSAYADWIQKPNISAQEQAQTDKLIGQLKSLLAKYPAKASTVAARLQILESRTNNAKNRRIYARLWEVANSYAQTGQVTINANVSTALQSDSCVIPSNFHPRQPGKQENSSYLPISTLLLSVKQYDINRDWTLVNDNTKRIVGDEPLHFRMDVEKILLLNSLDFCKLTIGKIGNDYWLVSNSRIEDSSMIANISMPDAGKYAFWGGEVTSKTPSLSLEDLKHEVKQYIEMSSDDLWLKESGGFSKDLSYFFRYTNAYSVNDALLSDLPTYFPNFKNSVLAHMTNGEYILTKESWYELSDTNEIRTLTNNITKGLNSDNEKVLAIYGWIVSNIKYDKAAYDENSVQGDSKLAAKASNPVTVFEKKLGICNGYAKLLVLMLKMVWIQDVAYESGNVYWWIYTYSKAEPHAWVRIGDYYYDPTWDTGASNYMYFKLPQDIMYARNADNLSGNSTESIQQGYGVKLVTLAKKYKWQGYKLLEPYENK